jgi:hypothetical protein
MVVSVDVIVVFITIFILFFIMLFEGFPHRLNLVWHLLVSYIIEGDIMISKLYEGGVMKLHP